MPNPFFEPVFQNFRLLLDEYGFQAASEAYDPAGFGVGLLRLASQRYFIHFRVDGMGPAVTIDAGRSGGSPTDLAWIFAYLTRGLAQPSGPGAWLYYFPHFNLGLWGDAAVRWQLARLADALKPLWPAIFIFLDSDGPRGADFVEFQERARRAEAEQAADSYRWPGETRAFPQGALADRAGLGFESQAQKSFAFLAAYGFKLASSDPLLVRFEYPGKTEGALAGLPPVYANIYHRPVSYLVGAQVAATQASPSFELNFDLEEMAAWYNKEYRPAVGRSPAELNAALNQCARAFRQLAAPLLAGDARLLNALLARRVDAAQRASRAFAERSRR